MARFGHTVTDADLVAYADGEAGGVSKDEIDAYLAEHPADAARVETWRRQGEIIRAAFSRVAAEPLPAALLVTQPKPVRTDTSAPLREPRDAPIRRVVRLHRRKVARNARITIAAIAFAVGGALTLYIAVLASGHSYLPEFLQPGASLSRPESAPAANDQTLLLARRAGEAHRAYASGADVAHPGELIPANDPTLAAWLSRRTGLAVRPPNFSSDGLSLLGGRVTPGELGPAAFLLYTSVSGDRVGLFMARLVGDEISGPVYREDRGAAILTWTGAGVGYALTAAGNRDHLLRLWRMMQGR